MILRITDGVTTVNLTGGTSSFYLAEAYAPGTPELSVVEATAEAVRDGGEVTAVTRRNVVETVTLAVVASAFSTVQAAIRGLEVLLQQAQHRQSTRKGAAVYVEYRAADSGDVYRSELLYGRVELDGATGAEGWIAGSALRCMVLWQRRYYWEGPRAELALQNTSVGSKTTGGVTVYNHSDGATGHNNWVDIAAGDVGGVIPTPAEIALYNSFNSASRTSRAFIANNVYSAPTLFTHILEAEDASSIVGGAAATADANSSNGYRQTFAWAGNTETNMGYWPLSGTFLDRAKGARFRLLARVTGASSGVRISARVLLVGLTTVAETPEVALSSGLNDLGILQLPPWLTGQTGLYELGLYLYGRLTGGATVTLDYVQLTPLDGYRQLRPRGYGAAFTTTIVDDGIENALYVQWGAAGKSGHYVGNGAPLQLFPTVAQRLYFLFTNDTGGTDIARTHSVRVYYRPRRLTI